MKKSTVAKKSKMDPMINGLEHENEKDSSYISWLEEQISNKKEKISQRQKIIAKLKRL